VALSAADSDAREFVQAPGTSQSGQSDLDLLAEIAARYDAHFWVEGDVLHLSRIPTETSPGTELAWGSTLLVLHPRVSTVGQVLSVSARFSMQWLPLALLVTVGWDLDREALAVAVRPAALPTDLPTNSAPTASLTLADQRIGGSADVVTSALALLHALRTRLNNRITATGSAVGDPGLLAGRLVRLSGLGPDFSGDYRIASATHVVDSAGYRTTFSVQRELLP
jgi:phage protein D